MRPEERIAQIAARAEADALRDGFLETEDEDVAPWLWQVHRRVRSELE